MSNLESFETQIEVPLQLKAWYLAKSASLGIKCKDLIKMALGAYMWQNSPLSFQESQISEYNGKKDDSSSSVIVPGNADNQNRENHEKCLGLQLAMFEKHLIEEALVQTDGNKSDAAKILGISKRTMRYKIKRYGL
jgi:transcriptional regulator with PAS, ATPase and Fis domain